MDFPLLPPRHQLVEMLTRIYEQGMTTTSGGNLSIKDDEGNIWITPAGVDKGNLTPADIVCCRPDGQIDGLHRPSSEYPFHRMIYQARPDLRALVHAHPPGLVAFSIARKLPDTRINPQSRDVCGEVGYAAYALPGSEALGKEIADTFSKGFNSVMLENHGVVTGGVDLLDAFHRFETLEYCAQINIRANALGGYRTLTDAEIDRFSFDNALPTFDPAVRSSRERELRLELCAIVQRAYARRLMISTGGTVSVRISGGRFLITPYGFDRKYVEPDDLVLIDGVRAEVGKTPSRSVRLHEKIYAAHPTINCIMSAQPPNATTYSIVNQHFDTRTIPESYLLLRDLPVAPYGLPFEKPEQVAAMLSKDTPVILLQNDAVLATGGSVLEAFDRMEVAEFSAQALIQSLSIGQIVPIGDEEIDHLKKKFLH
jgi:L-fuculose-phosphate aldolase